jgi:hypothetical protein
LAKRLSAEQCRSAAATLQGIEERSESWKQIAQAERQFSLRAFGWQGRINFLLKSLSSSTNALKTGAIRAEQRFLQNQNRRRLLLVSLARRAYQLEKGQPAKGWADLVPSYLNATPRDPFTGELLEYRQ